MHRALCCAAWTAAFMLTACAAQENNNGYRVVEMDITYTPQDQRDREWHALMAALDRCHAGGFGDAQPAAPPKRQCLEQGNGDCLRYAAHLSWDCIGMGYQPN